MHEPHSVTDSTEGAWPGRYFDGEMPVGAPATVWVTPGGLEFQLGSGERRVWRFDEIRQSAGGGFGDGARFERGDELPQTLIVNDRRIIDQIRAAGGAEARRFRAPAGARRLWIIGLGAGAAIVAILLAIYLLGIPALSTLAAKRVPLEWEQRFGAEMINHVAPPSRRIEGHPVNAAIEQIESRLVKGLGRTPYTFDIIVLDQNEVNAFAAPGGYIVVLRGMLEATRSPEELAGVLAHEMQHVVRRHSLQRILQQMSMGLLVMILVGDQNRSPLNGVELAKHLGELSYSRRAETEADLGAVRQLRDANIDPAGALAVLEHLRGQAGVDGRSSFLSSHPGVDERMARIREEIERGTPVRVEPFPNGADWPSLVKGLKSERRAHGSQPR